MCIYIGFECMCIYMDIGIEIGDGERETLVEREREGFEFWLKGVWYKDDDETQIDGAEKVCVFFFLGQRWL